MDMGVLQRILEGISQSVVEGDAALFPILQGFVGLFGLFGLLWACYGILWNGHALQSAIGFGMRLGLVSWTLSNWHWILTGLRDMAITLGIIAMGDTLKLPDFLDPGLLVKCGLDSALVLWKAFDNNKRWTVFVTGGAYLGAWLAYMAAFCVISYKIFWWQAEMLFASLAGLCLLPTLAFRATAFVATGVLSYAANMFARFALGALLTGALWKHLTTITAPAPGLPPSLAALDITIQAAFVAVGTAWILAACFFAVNRMAGMLTSGIPGMAGGNSLGALARTVAGGVMGLASAGATAAAGMLGAARGGAAGVQGLLGAGQSTGSAIRMLTSGGGEAHRIGAAARQLYAGAREGMSGGAQARLGQLMGSVSSVATRSGQQSLQQLMRSTRQGGHDQSHGGVRR